MRLITLISFNLFLTSHAQETQFVPHGGYIPPPECHLSNNPSFPLRQCSEAELSAWRSDVDHWRQQARLRAGYSGEQYSRPELFWTQSSYIQPLLMVEDRYLYDSETKRYTVDRYLDDLERRYGGIDAVLIWHVYPNTGVDNRNQYDMLRAMPGGLAGVKEMVAAFHRCGVRVLFPILVWDQGTRAEGKPDPQAISEILTEVGADGINGDTLFGMPRVFRAASDQMKRPLALEPEMPPSDEGLMWNNMSWIDAPTSFSPSMSRGKWIESRHMLNVSDRWNHERIASLQLAWFNGVGYESWENVWSIWNGMTPRDAEATRRVGTLERAFSAFLVSKDWVPFTPTLRFGVFASSWPLNEQCLITLINRNKYDVQGREISLPYKQGYRYYDIYHGVELSPQRQGDRIVLEFDIEAAGFGALFVTETALDPSTSELLKKMNEISSHSLSTYSSQWEPLQQHLVPIAKTSPAGRQSEDRVLVPAADYVFQVHGTEIEGEEQVGVDVQYPWENAPRRYHEHKLHINAFWIDKYPVTNEKFLQFLRATHYHPDDDVNFLKDWKGGAYPAGWAKKPVTWISIEDARAYCSSQDARLPHEWEWQYALQGKDDRTYPWGNQWNQAEVPEPDTGRDLRGPDNVDAHPSSVSSFGVADLVGNVWQWTDEFQDAHTRSAVLRGGSYYRPQGSRWYFPQAYEADEHSKLLLMSPSKDRAGTIGFRCTIDTQSIRQIAR